MTLREIVNETVDPKTVQQQITQLVTGATGLQKSTQLNAQKLTDSTTTQQLSLQAKKLAELTNGVNNSFQELVKQNIAMQQQQQNNQNNNANNQAVNAAANAQVPAQTINQ